MHFFVSSRNQFYQSVQSCSLLPRIMCCYNKFPSFAKFLNSSWWKCWRQASSSISRFIIFYYILVFSICHNDTIKIENILNNDIPSRYPYNDIWDPSKIKTHKIALKTFISILYNSCNFLKLEILVDCKLFTRFVVILLLLFRLHSLISWKRALPHVEKLRGDVQNFAFAARQLYVFEVKSNSSICI